MKKLEELTLVEYETLKSINALFKLYPHAKGHYSLDCKSGGFNKVEENDLTK